jgi:DTW domain-containing protein YfiP
VELDIAVTILQDPTESKHAKNTARLIPLILPQTEIFSGLGPDDFSRTQQKVRDISASAVIYPSDNAFEIDTNNTPKSGTEAPLKHLILIDGSWRKAKKLWLNNPWLHSLPAIAINSSEVTQYRIRKAPFAKSFSTIEALAITLAAYGMCDTAPFICVLEEMQSKWQG